MPLTYVYCVVRSAKVPDLRTAPAAMPNAAAVRALAAGKRTWAIVSSVSARDYSESALSTGLQNLEWVSRRAVAHEAVVEHFLTASAILPMQLFTLFTSDERALEYIAHERGRIDGILERLDGQLEWGLRLSFDEQAARAAVEQAHQSTGARRKPANAGTAYLARKRDLFDVTRVHLTKAQAAADRLYRAMSREATDTRRRSATEQATPGSRLLLDAAFLVPARRVDAFRAALKQQTRKLSGSALVVSLTGPWPAYNFVDEVDRRRRKTVGARTASRTSATPRTSATTRKNR